MHRCEYAASVLRNEAQAQWRCGSRPVAVDRKCPLQPVAAPPSTPPAPPLSGAMACEDHPLRLLSGGDMVGVESRLAPTRRLNAEAAAATADRVAVACGGVSGDRAAGLLLTEAKRDGPGLAMPCMLLPLRCPDTEGAPDAAAARPAAPAGASKGSARGSSVGAAAPPSEPNAAPADAADVTEASSAAASGCPAFQIFQAACVTVMSGIWLSLHLDLLHGTHTCSMQSCWPASGIPQQLSADKHHSCNCRKVQTKGGVLSSGTELNLPQPEGCPASELSASPQSRHDRFGGLQRRLIHFLACPGI